MGATFVPSPLLKDAIELHVHCSPSIFPRRQTIWDLVADIKTAGMAGALIKAHEMPTAGITEVVRGKEPALQVYGGVVLNHLTGGLSPSVVDSAIRAGAKMIWMPTISSQAHMDDFAKKPGKLFGGSKPLIQPSQGLKIWDDQERILPEVHQILDLIAEADIALATGHLSPAEVSALVDTAIEHGVTRILVQHVDVPIVPIPFELQVKLAQKGAILEKCYLACTEFGDSSMPLAQMAESIKQLGAGSCVLVTDYGQAHNVPPVQALDAFAEKIQAQGIPKKEIRTMLVDNPRRILGLSPQEK